MRDVEKVVFDCNVLLQGLISPRGPAHSLVDSARQGRLALFLSAYVLDELRDVASRSGIRSKFRLTNAIIENYANELLAIAQFVEVIPHVFDFPRDPDDAHYVNLALAVEATLIVSRDGDLLSLANPELPEGRHFQARFPRLMILTPPQALQRLAAKFD